MIIFQAFKFKNMKNTFVILFIFSIMLMSCKPVRPYYSNFVKLNATISDSAANIRLGDTLKIKFTIPDTITAISNGGASQNVIVNTLQECFYVYSFYKVDTITHIGQRLSGIYTVISNGYGSDGVI